jgi:uncharacterized protein (UPF0332 family)
MSFADKVAENKKVAEKCMEIKAYNAGVTRAYYSAFLRIKDYLIDKEFDYDGFLQRKKPGDRAFSHGTIQAAITTCLMANGKKNTDVCKLKVLSSMYYRRRKADYDEKNIIEPELESSLKDLNIVLSIID